MCKGEQSRSGPVRDPIRPHRPAGREGSEQPDLQHLQLLSGCTVPLLRWFDENARDLPWRQTSDPYRIWISEIMLQQTRVEAVRPYYIRFIEELPDVEALSACPEDRLLKLWEGLGYYSRVRNMQKAARICNAEYEGKLPDDYVKLLSLPGIGPYTAGAVASIAFGESVPAVDGNVLRVISRLLMLEENILEESVRRRIQSLLQEVMLQDASLLCFDGAGKENHQALTKQSGRYHPGTYNQALMELGATVCSPGGAPDCILCPLKEQCLARKEDAAARVPVRISRTKRREEHRTVLVIRDSKAVLLRKRSSKGLLAGLYELPNVEGSLDEEAALDTVRDFGCSPVRIRPLTAAKHVFSHITWQMSGYLVTVEELEQRSLKDGLLVVSPAQTQKQFPIPSAFAAYTVWLDVPEDQRPDNLC